MAAYFDLSEQLTALIGYPVDVVMSGAVRNLIFRADIDRGRQTLYAA